MNFAIIGAGAWGTAMALHLAREGHRVTLTARRWEQALSLSSQRENRDYLPGYPLEPNIQIGCEIAPVLMEADVALLACPSSALRETCRRVQAARKGAWQLQAAVALCKGLEKETYRRPAEVIAEELPDLAPAVFSGPTFADEVAGGLPTAATLAAAENTALLEELQVAMAGPKMRVYRSEDLTGIELGGCLKNIYAIGAGIIDGLEFGSNTKAAYLTRALREMVRLGTALGGTEETFYGLSGFGDLVATCTGRQSRNRSFGEALAKGESARSYIETHASVVEGFGALAAFHPLCEEKQLSAPILQELYRVCYDGGDIRHALAALMTRELKHEFA